MKIIKLLSCLSLLVISTNSFAYRIYNNLDGTETGTRFGVYVVDVHGFGGINAYVKRNDSIACSPKSFGCHGTLHFQVQDEYDRDILCEGEFKIDKSSGNYFVIRSSYVNGAICTITHYKD